MKAILVIDIPDDIWANKEDDLGVYIELWSKRIDDGWCAEYTIDNLKPMPKKKKQQVPLVFKDENDIPKEVYKYGKIDGYNECLKEILGEE